jgi:hypothetical protein
MFTAKEWNVQQSMSWAGKELVSSDDSEDRKKYASLVDPCVFRIYCWESTPHSVSSLQIHRPFFYIVFHFMKINGCRDLMGKI